MAVRTLTEGNDQGAFGEDQIFCLGGNDTVDARNPVYVEIFGGSGDDGLGYAGFGTIVMHGGNGDDEVDNGSGAAVTYLFGDGGDDIVDGDRAGGNSFLYGGAGDDQILGGFGDELASGGGGSDDVSGGDGNDTLNGDGADDDVSGGNGNDLMSGDAGDDGIEGNAGADSLYGGNGGDGFVYEQVTDSTPLGRDTVFDFSRQQGDFFDVTAVDANALRQGNQEFDFIKKLPFSGTVRELRYADGLLQGDTNGDGLADFEVALVGVGKLKAADFLL